MLTQSPISLTDTRYRLGYHVMAPSGWINDPNGFCYFKGYYHIFYQYYPYAAEWGPMHWGHARSTDLVHWETLPIALTPGDPEDAGGCFSGSAIVKNDKLYLIYTGQHYYDDDDPDHFWENQNLAYSTDGIHFTKYELNPIIAQAPADNTQHFRDPKVWAYDGNYYLALGSQAQDGLGRVITYRSTDLLHWQYLGPITKATNANQEGYMWECPDFFYLNGQHVLLTSPQGIVPTPKKYLNLHETGYFIGTYDYQTNQFQRDTFKELDHGHDFYATQTTLTPDGRRIVIGWLAMWESLMPEQADGWAGALTLPRELVLHGNHLGMRPIAETKQLRQEKLLDDKKTFQNQWLLSTTERHLEFQIELEDAQTDFTFKIASPNGDTFTKLAYLADSHEFVLSRSDREDQRYATIDQSEKVVLAIFIDQSSAEIFINDGAATFSERFYMATAPTISLETKSTLTASVTTYKLAKDAIKF